MINRRLLVFLLVAVLYAAVALPPHARTAYAVNGLDLYTPFPGLQIKAGQTVDFNVEVINSTSGIKQVQLRLAEVPEGWDARIQGGSWNISRVLVQAQNSRNIRLEIDIPPDAAPGTHQVRLEAVEAGQITPLEMNIEVSEEGGSTAELTTDYPVLSGPVDAEFKFRVELNNNTAQAQLFGLSAVAPEGWRVFFQPSYDSNRIASISLEENASKNLDVTVVPPNNARAGEYTVAVQAQSPGADASTELRVDITGNYELTLATEDERLNATAVAGQASNLGLVVTNTGSSNLENVSLRASTPSNWNVEFEPAEIDSLPAGESREVVARITPNSQALAGDYAISLSASADAASDQADIRVAVRTSTLWGLVGLAIVLLVAGGVVYLFRSYGRR